MSTTVSHGLSRASYQALRRKQSATIYFQSEQDLAAHKLVARDSGYPNFNAWILQMVQNAQSGSVYPPEYVEGIKKDADKLRSWLDAAREEASDYRAQLKHLQSQRDMLLTILHGFPEGGEVAAKFLQQHTASRVVA